MAHAAALAGSRCLDAIVSTEAVRTLARDEYRDRSARQLSLTKGVVCGLLANGPITCALDDQQEPRRPSLGLLRFARSGTPLTHVDNAGAGGRLECRKHAKEERPPAQEAMAAQWLGYEHCACARVGVLVSGEGESRVSES